MTITAGGCHCKATRFELAHAPTEVTSCNCSICSKRGALWAYYQPSDVTFTQHEADSVYQWGAKMCSFHFCPRCGCSTYNETPSWTEKGPDPDHPLIAINARLIDDFDPDAVQVRKVDGKNEW